MVLLDRAAGERATDGAGDRRQLAAVAAADLVADQAAGSRATDGAADVARITARRLLLHHDVVAFLMRRGHGRGLPHRIGADDLRVQLLLLGHRCRR